MNLKPPCSLVREYSIMTFVVNDFPFIGTIAEVLCMSESEFRLESYLRYGKGSI
jgi:hypothetical protein